MKKSYCFISLGLLTPMVGITTGCYNNKPVIGYGYLKSLKLVNNSTFTQPDSETPGTGLIISSDKGTVWSILDHDYQRFNTLGWVLLPLPLPDYRFNDAFTFIDWSKLQLELDMTIHFKQTDFDSRTWTWLNEPGTYNAASNSLATIFDPKTMAHFQYTFNVYHEVNTTQGVDPTYRANQLLFRASSSTINYQLYTSLINQFLTLNIVASDDGVDWNLSWIAPLCSFYDDWKLDNNLLNFEFKLLTTSTDASQIITPFNDVIGFKYETPPKSQYFTIINDYFGKKWY